jgi:hypothetical protein
MHEFLFISIYNSLHVLSRPCSSTGETNCINTASGKSHFFLVNDQHDVQILFLVDDQRDAQSTTCKILHSVIVGNDILNMMYVFLTVLYIYFFLYELYLHR